MLPSDLNRLQQLANAVDADGYEAGDDDAIPAGLLFFSSFEDYLTDRQREEFYDANFRATAKERIAAALAYLHTL